MISFVCCVFALFSIVGSVPNPDGINYRVYDICGNDPLCLRGGQQCSHVFDEVFDYLDDALYDNMDWGAQLCLSQSNLNDQFMESAGSTSFYTYGAVKTFLDSLEQSAPAKAKDFRCCLMEKERFLTGNSLNVDYLKYQISDELDDSEEFMFIPNAIKAVDACGEPVDCKFEEYKNCLVKTCVDSFKNI